MAYDIEKFKTIEDLSELVKQLGLTPDKEVGFWKELLELLHSQEQPLPPKDPEKDCGLFYQIIEKIDFPAANEETAVSELYKKIKELEDEADYWNTSFYELVQYIKTLFSEDVDTTILPSVWAKGDITIETLQHGNAGENFSDDNELIEENEYVNPWFSPFVAFTSYGSVRKKDLVEQDALNPDRVQFTQSAKPTLEGVEGTIYSWLRLLMPQYTRRVLVEDLDRNFWVISMALAAMSHYLYGGDSPINKVFNGFLRELSELWENVLFLWTEIAALDAAKHKALRVISLPVQFRDNEHMRQYDLIDTDIPEDWYSYTIGEDGSININKGAHFDEQTISRLAYLTSKYENQDLVIAPYIRLGNYKHNYYLGEWYPCIYVYQYKTKKWSKVNLTEGDNKQIVISLAYDNRFAPYVYASRINNGRLLYTYPFSKVATTDTHDLRLMLYGSLRVIPKVEVPDGDITKLKVAFEVYDAVGESATNKKRLLGTFSQSTVEGNNVILSFDYAEGAKDIPSGIDESTLYSKILTKDTPGHYLGETPSWRLKTRSESKTENIFNPVAYVIKIGSYLPGNASVFQTATIDQDGTHTSMKGNLTTRYNAQGDLKFFLNDWTTYLPSVDNKKGKDPCFSAKPSAHLYKEVTNDFLQYYGLRAVKNYLQKTNNLSQPCFVVTALGLTPWQNGDVFYWDNGGICHIYHYIPSQSSLAKQPTDKSYSDEYSKYNALKYNLDEQLEENGIISINGVEKGKVISCNVIHRGESFFDTFGMVKNGKQSYQPVDQPALWWRQFRVIQDGDSEKCSCVTYNESDSDMLVTYDVKFATAFIGKVNYYDNRWALLNSMDAFGPAAQNGMAPVKIEGAKYEQTGDGYIALASAAIPDITKRENLAANTKNTGFMMTTQFIPIVNPNPGTRLSDNIFAPPGATQVREPMYFAEK